MQGILVQSSVTEYATCLWATKPQITTSPRPRAAAREACGLRAPTSSAQEEANEAHLPKPEEYRAS